MKKIFIILAFGVLLSLSGCGHSKNIAATSNTQPKESTTVSNSNSMKMQYYFPRAKQYPDKELIDVINSSKNNLDIAIYSITKKEIVNAIIKAKNRGVNVRIITDKQESSNKAQNKELALLKKADIPIKINSHSGLMHLKVTIADKKVVTTGSYNYTEGATNLNDEVLVVIQDSSSALDFDKEFERMWNDDSNFKEY